jgi:hypothetical protein
LISIKKFVAQVWNIMSLCFMKAGLIPLNILRGDPTSNKAQILFYPIRLLAAGLQSFNSQKSHLSIA